MKIWDATDLKLGQGQGNVDLCFSKDPTVNPKTQSDKSGGP